jgi:hypothetical protein
MIGNVGEWVCDEYTNDPMVRTIRGGDQLGRNGYADRYPEIRHGSGPYTGFRVVVDIDKSLLSILSPE